MASKINLFDFQFDNLTLEEAIEKLVESTEQINKSYVVPVNVDMVVKADKDNSLKKIIQEADVVLADGMPLVWFSKKIGIPLKEKVSGSDLIPALCQKANKTGHSIFILGGKEAVAERAKENLKKQYPNICIKGTYAPPFGFEKDSKEIEKINTMITEAHPDFLIVCFGCPKQEKFVYENYDKYEAKVSICAGATVDFLAGDVKRAPKWMSNHGLEWFYRFLQEPKRMFKRYFIDDLKFINILLKYR